MYRVDQLAGTVDKNRCSHEVALDAGRCLVFADPAQAGAVRLGPAGKPPRDGWTVAASMRQAQVMTAYVQIPISNRILHFSQDEPTLVAERIVAAMEGGRPSRFSHAGGYLLIDFTALGSVEVMSDQPVDYDLSMAISATIDQIQGP
jgi:hypothetical protein